jgi:putative membrane protein
MVGRCRVLGLLLRWIVGAITLFVIAYFVPGFHIRNFSSALVAVLVIGLLNATIGFLLKVLTFPLSILTLGLFLLVINAFMLIVASRLVPGFHVDTFGSAFVGAVVLALVHMLLGMGTKRERRAS